MNEKPYYIETRGDAMAYRCAHDDAICERQPCEGDCRRRLDPLSLFLTQRYQSEPEMTPEEPEVAQGEWPGMDLLTLRALVHAQRGTDEQA